MQDRRSQAGDATSGEYEGREYGASGGGNMVFDWMSSCFGKLIAQVPAQLSFILLSLLGQPSQVFGV